MVVVGETRKLVAGLAQDVADLFKDRFTFGMMEESCRKCLLSQYLHEGVPSPEGDKAGLYLENGLTLHEVAHRTPGYEAGDLLRLIRAIQMELLAAERMSDDDGEENEIPKVGFTFT